MMAKDATVRQVVAVSAHEIPHRAPLHLAVGQPVEVGERDTRWPAFVFVTAPHGAGWVPTRHLSATTGTAVAIADYDTTELPTRVG